MGIFWYLCFWSWTNGFSCCNIILLSACSTSPAPSPNTCARVYLCMWVSLYACRGACVCRLTPEIKKPMKYKQQTLTREPKHYCSHAVNKRNTGLKTYKLCKYTARLDITRVDVTARRPSSVAGIWDVNVNIKKNILRREIECGNIWKKEKRGGVWRIENEKVDFVGSCGERRLKIKCNKLKQEDCSCTYTYFQIIVSVNWM